MHVQVRFRDEDVAWGGSPEQDNDSLTFSIEAVEGILDVER